MEWMFSFFFHKESSLISNVCLVHYLKNNSSWLNKGWELRLKKKLSRKISQLRALLLYFELDIFSLL